MFRALGDGEHDAGCALARRLEKTDAIRPHAYRLSTLCDRKGWTEHARPDNERITSCPRSRTGARRAV
jgi:putative DNA methylase